MKYAEYTRDTKEPLKRLAHGGRLRQATRIVPIQPHYRVLDYGCGDGGLFEHLADFTQKKNLFGFDPWLLDEMTFKGATTYDRAEDLTDAQRGAFDLVFCMEVCEHLSHEATIELFRNLRITGKRDATFVFGVPIETGFSGFSKNIYRFFRGRRQNATLGRALKSLFGLWIPRAFSAEGWTGSHIGFDSAAFRELLDYGGFEVIQDHHLPWPFLRGFFNNEVYFVCKRNSRKFPDDPDASPNTRKPKYLSKAHSH